MNTQDIQQLADSALKYGPFFFSILFVIFLTRWAYRQYNTAVTRVPPLPAPDQSVNRSMFLVTFYFGLFLVVISIVWWWWFKPGTYFFRGEIQNLQPQDDIAADSYYLREDLHKPAGDATAGLLRNEHFLIVQTHPFKQGQQFVLDYAKNHQRSTQLWITYEPSEDEPIYTIDYDPTKQLSYLRRQGPTPAPTRSLLLNDWRAAYVYAAHSVAAPSDPAPDSHDINVNHKLINVLQDTRSDVATKLNAVDELNGTDPHTLQAYLSEPLPEPFALTIFDLTQHSDPELAAKATALTKRINIDSYLVSQLVSEQPRIRMSAESILLRISRSHAQAILSHIDAGKYLDLRQTKEQVDSGQYQQILKPTASTQGDRYYIKASWNPAQGDVVSCLTTFFNSSLESTRKLSDEQQLMAGKSQRYVYWYSKKWVLDASKAVKQCGGSAEFVHPY